MGTAAPAGRSRLGEETLTKVVGARPVTCPGRRRDAVSRGSSAGSGDAHGCPAWAWIPVLVAVVAGIPGGVWLYGAITGV